VFALPFILTFLIFFAYPIVNTIFMSFEKVGGGNYEFVGLSNYQTLFKNAVFYKCLRNSILYTILSCALMIPIPMILATMLNSKHMVGKTAFRSIMFVPALTSVVVAGVIFRLMFGELEGSFMNQVIGAFGHEPMIWLRTPLTVWITMLVLCLWRWTGVNMMYYLSGLQQISEDLYESASIDGATGLQTFRYITLPMLKPTTIYVLTISIFGGMAMFTESYLLFNGNNSPNNVGTTLVGFLYRIGMEQNNIGIGSAIGVILLIIVMVINVIQLALNGTFSKGEK
ncbi:MAG: sugar ABC transporter permease, partial [Lachnospiraceae bacterium]|nr:sugar ABC transporter permease [Lachnospiraceae bacterium]